jgi:hypothetical protein
MVLLIMRKTVLLGVALLSLLTLLSSCSGRGADNEPVRTYQMGERVVVAPLTYAVYEQQWLAQLGTGSDARLPQNRFLLIRLSATNGGGTEGYVPSLTLVDDGGNSCAEVSNGDSVPHWMGYLRPIKPADTLQGNILFDCIPKHYRLKVVNEDGGMAYVDIPLSFEAETPSIDIPTKDEKSSNLKHPNK